MIPRTSLVPLPDLTREIARLLPEYLPRVSTGRASLTEGRSCWIHAWKTLLTAVGRERSMEMREMAGRRIGATRGGVVAHPHHIEGEHYLALNLLGSEQKAAAHAIVIPRNGNLNAGDFERLLPLPGSPYPWGDRRRESR